MKNTLTNALRYLLKLWQRIESYIEFKPSYLITGTQGYGQKVNILERIEGIGSWMTVRNRAGKIFIVSFDELEVI